MNSAGTSIPNLKIRGKTFEKQLADAILVSVKVTQELNQHSWCQVVCRRSDQNPGDRIYPEEGLATHLRFPAMTRTAVKLWSFKASSLM